MATTNSQSPDLSSLPAHTALRIEIQVAGLRQFTIAQRLGMSEGQLSKVLSGRRPLDEDLADRIRAAIAQGSAQPAVAS